MRATAITLVLLHHFLELVRLHAPWVLPFYDWGQTGVDMFFALSGFLIGRILLKLDSRVVRPRELLRFWARRWLRTLPLYYVTLLLRLLVTCAVLSYLHVMWGFWHMVPVRLYFFFMQSWAWPPPPFFTETWSLAVEEWFYLIFPLLWVAVIRSGARPFMAFILASVFMLFASTILRLDAPLLASDDWIYRICHVTIYNFDRIAFGLLAAALCRARPRIWSGWCWPGLVFGVGLLWLDRHWVLLDFVHKENGYLSTWHCSVTGLGSTLLLPWCSRVQKLFWAPLHNLAGLISRWSYSLYLTHSMFLGAAMSLFGRQIYESATWAWATLAILSCVSFALAGVLHNWIEQPGMNLRERWKISRQAQVDPV